MRSCTGRLPLKEHTTGKGSESLPARFARASEDIALESMGLPLDGVKGSDTEMSELSPAGQLARREARSQKHRGVEASGSKKKSSPL